MKLILSLALALTISGCVRNCLTARDLEKAIKLGWDVTYEDEKLCIEGGAVDINLPSKCWKTCK